MRTVARVVMLAGMLCLPFVLLALANRRQDGAGMILIYPFFFTVPLALSAVVVFAPIERALDGHGLGRLKNAGVPLLGAAAVALLALGWLVLLAALTEPGTARRPPNARTIGERIPGVLAVGGTLGAIGGTLWRLTDWVATLLGLRGNA